MLLYRLWYILIRLPETVIILTRWSIRPDGLNENISAALQSNGSLKKSVFNYRTPGLNRSLLHAEDWYFSSYTFASLDQWSKLSNASCYFPSLRNLWVKEATRGFREMRHRPEIAITLFLGCGWFAAFIRGRRPSNKARLHSGRVSALLIY